jgi:hypothetical protein
MLLYSLFLSVFPSFFISFCLSFFLLRRLLTYFDVLNKMVLSFCRCAKHRAACCVFRFCQRWRVTRTTALIEAADTSLALPNWALISHLQKEFLWSAAQGDPHVLRTRLRSMFRTALWKRLWIVKDKECGNIQLLVFVPTKLLFFLLRLRTLLTIQVV